MMRVMTTARTAATEMVVLAELLEEPLAVDQLYSVEPTPYYCHWSLLYNALWCVSGPFGGHFRTKTQQNRPKMTPKGSKTHPK